MALALLTGCGKATSLNRTVAEGMGDYLNYLRSHYGNPDPVSVSYQVPELGRNIAPCLMKTGSSMTRTMNGMSLMRIT